MKSPKERKADERQRHKQAGRVQMCIYIKPEDKAQVHALVKTLREKEKKEVA